MKVLHVEVTSAEAAPLKLPCFQTFQPLKISQCRQTLSHHISQV